MLRRNRLLMPVLACLLAGGFGIGGAHVAVAQSKAPESPSAERQRLRRALDDVQAEIDQLKNAGPGLRTDYRLRARMADAEALARRLTELDAIGRPGPAPQAVAPAMTEPGAAPTDGPAELEAKADILADQSRRVQLQIVALKTRIDQVRGRQELRRRTRQMDNDPFAPLEGSKRRVVSAISVAAGPAAPAVPGLPGRAGGAGTPQIDAFGPASAPTGNSTPSTPTGGGAATTPTPTPTPTPTSTSAPSAQLRDMLDPSTLAQIRKLEQDGAAPGSVESMEKAVALLTAKAQHLDAQSKLLRTKAHAH